MEARLAAVESGDGTQTAADQKKPSTARTAKPRAASGAKAGEGAADPQPKDGDSK